MENNPEDNAMRRAQQAVVLVGVAIVLFAITFSGWRTGVSVAAGATIAALNLYVLSKTVRRMVEGKSASWASAAVLKFLLLLCVTYVLIESEWVQPVGLAIGFGALPLGIVLASTLGSIAGDPPTQIDHKVKRDHA